MPDNTTSRQRMVVIINPETGRRRASDIERLVRRALDVNFDLTIVRSRYPGDARVSACQMMDAADIIVAVGGDGTVSDVAGAVIGTKTPIAIIPTGSTNVIARNLGIPLKPRKAIQLLLAETTLRTIDAAVSGERVMLHMAGSGLDAVVMRDATRSLKRIAAWMAYVPPLLANLARARWSFRLTLDGVELNSQAGMILVANGGFILRPRFQAGQGIKADDGYLDVCIFSPNGWLQAWSMIFWLLLGRIQRSRHLQQIRAKSVAIEATPPAPIELDGDFAGITPLELSVVPGAIHFVVPKTRELPYG